MTHTFMKVTFGVMAAIYAIVCAIGVSWLVYFNRKRVRETFAGLPGQVAESRRPILISVVALFSLIGGLSCLLATLLPFPGAFLGFILHGWEKPAVYLTYAALLIAAGVGLWRLEEWGRRLALVLQVVWLAQNIVLIARPSLITKYSEEISKTMNVAQPQFPTHLQNTMYAATFGFSALLILAIMAILHHYRGAFRPPILPDQTGPNIAA
jgi:hypothetical protein